jgi:hypothetical protein
LRSELSVADPGSVNEATWVLSPSAVSVALPLSVIDGEATRETLTESEELPASEIFTAVTIEQLELSVAVALSVTDPAVTPEAWTDIFRIKGFAGYDRPNLAILVS